MSDISNTIRAIKRSVALVVSVAKDKPIGTGTGFIFGKSNILVTCNHVIKDASSIEIKFSDSTGFIPGKTVLQDNEHDLALLRFDDASRDPIPKGDLNTVCEGMQVLFSGFPFSSENMTTHQGIISAIIKDQTGIESYLLDGTVNAGNSGCPLLTMEGMVIGVINAKRRTRNDLLQQVEKMCIGAISLHGVDIVEIYQALAANIQLGVGYAVPAKYIPGHKNGTL